MFEKDIPAVILSGGQSRRMNKNDKAFVSINDKTLLETVLERLQSQTPNIAVNTNSDNPKYARYGVPILIDEIRGFLGPLVGVFSAMKWANKMGYNKVATVAVDTPLFPENLLKELHKKMEVSNSDIVFAISQSDHNKKKVLHPVFGLWKTYLLNDLKREIEKGVRKVTLWSERHGTASVHFSYELVDPFFNINTPDDIIMLKEYLKIR